MHYSVEKLLSMLEDMVAAKSFSVGCHHKIEEEMQTKTFVSFKLFLHHKVVEENVQFHFSLVKW